MFRSWRTTWYGEAKCASGVDDLPRCLSTYLNIQAKGRERDHLDVGS